MKSTDLATLARLFLACAFAGVPVMASPLQGPPSPATGTNCLKQEHLDSATDLAEVLLDALQPAEPGNGLPQSGGQLFRARLSTGSHPNSTFERVIVIHVGEEMDSAGSMEQYDPTSSAPQDTRFELEINKNLGPPNGKGLSKEGVLALAWAIIHEYIHIQRKINSGFLPGAENPRDVPMGGTTNDGTECGKLDEEIRTLCLQFELMGDSINTLNCCDGSVADETPPCPSQALIDGFVDLFNQKLKELWLLGCPSAQVTPPCIAASPDFGCFQNNILPVWPPIV